MRCHLLNLYIILSLFSIREIYAKQDCNKEIFCFGPILHAVQMSNIMNDSKQFVDMKLKYSLNTVKSNFEKIKSRDEQSIKAFLEENFENVESEYLEEVPSDWKDSPQFLTTIKSHNLRVLAGKLHGMWKDLSKIINPEIGKSDHYSLIYVPNVVIMPGGFLREYYYWDTYWIVLGLLGYLKMLIYNAHNII